MIEPTPPQLERLKEIASKNFFPHEEKRALACLLTVWREAQEEKELLKKQHDFQVDQMEEVRAAFSHGADDDQWKPGATIAESIRGLIKEKQQLEASLKMAVERLKKSCDCERDDYDGRRVNWCSNCLTLSTIRTNHPGLFPEEKK